MNASNDNETHETTMMSTRVLIIGRGPAGMTFALRLASFGIDCVIADPIGWEAFPGSKALCMQRESMEILERVGCGKAMASGGVSWHQGSTFYRDKEVSQVRFPAFTGTGFPPFVNFAQRETEILLLDRLRENTLVHKLFGHSLISLKQDDVGVEAVLKGNNGTVHCKADYIIGCDGSRSTLRKELGVTFNGTSYTTNFMIFDIRAKLPFANERRLYFSPSFNKDRTVLVHPLPDGDWHIDWQVGSEKINIQEELSSGRANDRIRSMIGDIPFEILWVTTYAFRSLIANKMQVGRAFIVGDAAHIVSPYGARGLNSGLADVDNLAWKLACVLTDRAPVNLLDSYQDERHPAAAENMRITDKTAQFMAPPSWLKKIKRKLVLAISARMPAASRFVNAGKFYEPAIYQTSAVMQKPSATAEKNLCGAVAPDAICLEVSNGDGVANQPVRLRDLMGQQFLVIIVAQKGFTRSDLDHKLLTNWPKNIPVARLVLVAPQWTENEVKPHSHDIVYLKDQENAIADAYLPDTKTNEPVAFLIRPDSYIAAQWSFENLSTLTDWVAFSVGRSPEPSSTHNPLGNI